jgi:hypothetical protein
MPGNAPELHKDDDGTWTVRLDEASQAAFVRWLCLTYAVPEKAAAALKGARGLIVRPASKA